MKVFICGPIDDFNSSRLFELRVKHIKSLDYEACNPQLYYSKLSKQNPSFETVARAMLKLLLDCDAITLMDGWQSSNAAVLCMRIAEVLKLRMIEVKAVPGGSKWQ